jgi:CheY-like chemotaxis protein
MRKAAILLADDDAEDRMIISMAFEEVGCAPAVHYAEDGEKALEYLSVSPKDQLPGLIILDLNMPRLNGLETLAAIKKDDTLSHIPVIILSTSIHDFSKEQCLQLGAAAYYTKPSTHKQTVEIAKQFCKLAEVLPAE